MFKSFVVSMLLVGLIGFLGMTEAHAHSVQILDSFEMSLDDTELIDHTDEDPWKGTLSLTVTNTGLDPWGDFHFQIMDPTNGSVTFRDDGGVIPSMGGVTAYEYEIVDGGLGLNFFFYDDPVCQNESVTFSVYTDNTSQMLSFFQIAMHATPVPLPGGICLLASGLMIGVPLIRKRIWE